MKPILFLPIAASIFLSVLTTSFCSCESTNHKVAEEPTVASTAPLAADSTQLLRFSEGIRSILEDRNGNLWFGSTDWTCFFDGSTYTYYTEKDDLCFNDSRIQEDKTGMIWIQSGKHLGSYDGKNFSFQTLSQDLATDEWDVQEDDLWIHRGIEQHANWEGRPGTYRLRNGEFEYLNLPVPDGEHTDQLFLVSCGPLLAQDGTLWFGTMEALIGFKDGEFTFIGREEMGLANDSRNIGIRGIFEDSEGNIWMADNGCGLFVFDGDTTINFTKQHGLDKGEKEGNTLHRAFSVSQDDDGNMWFGTVYSGIWKYDGTIFQNFAEDDGVNSQNIWTIYKTRSGELLFAGTRPGAVYTYNGAKIVRKY